MGFHFPDIFFLPGAKDAGKALEDLFRKVKDKDELPDIQVMMLGALRVGKTSVLASMINEFNAVTGDTNLVLTKVDGGKEIDEALKTMKGYFNGTHRLNETFFGMDTNATVGFNRFDLELKVAAKKSVKPRHIRFVDCSGEWINHYANEENAKAMIELSDVVIIAIDSVLLMEQKGRYNHQNHMEHITNFIKGEMNPDEVCNNHKMILFVPLKCEKYYHQNEDTQSIYYGERMDELNRRIKDEYSDLLGFLTKPNNKKYFTVAILPILTLGGLEFDEFTQEDGDEISIGKIQYRFCEPNCFSPKYCAQPLLYTLMFEQKQINIAYKEKNYNHKNKKLWTAVLKEWFADKRNLAKDIDYIAELDKLKKDLKRGGNGFEIIQDPMGL